MLGVALLTGNKKAPGCPGALVKQQILGLL
jgi:hypothetical protein